MNKNLQSIMSCSKNFNVVDLSQVEFVDVEGKAFVRKKRMEYAPLLSVLANGFLRRRYVPVQVLKREDWYRRECLIFNDLYGKEAYVDDRNGLLMEKLQGDTLRTHHSRFYLSA